MTLPRREFLYPELAETLYAREGARVSIILTRLYKRLHRENLLNIPDNFDCSLFFPEKGIHLSHPSRSPHDSILWMLEQLNKYLEIYGDTVHAIPRMQYPHMNKAAAISA